MCTYSLSLSLSLSLTCERGGGFATDVLCGSDSSVTILDLRCQPRVSHNNNNNSSSRAGEDSRLYLSRSGLQVFFVRNITLRRYWLSLANIKILPQNSGCFFMLLLLLLLSFDSIINYRGPGKALLFYSFLLCVKCILIIHTKSST